jgi:hypothetical protein
MNRIGLVGQLAWVPKRPASPPVDPSTSKAYQGRAETGLSMISNYQPLRRHRIYAVTLLSFVALTIAGKQSALAEVGRHALPDSRAYEQVSPVDKNESDVRFNSGVDAAFGGDGLVFTSDGSFAGQPTAQSQTSYLARRGAGGWVTRGIQMPNGRV